MTGTITFSYERKLSVLIFICLAIVNDRFDVSKTDSGFEDEKFSFLAPIVSDKYE